MDRPEIPLGEALGMWAAHMDTRDIAEALGTHESVVARRLAESFEVAQRRRAIESAEERAHILARAIEIINPERVLIRPIIEATAKFYGVTMAEMIGCRRTAKVAHARQVACYLAHKFTGASHAKIARMLGNRDPSTIHHARKKIERLVSIKAQLAEDVAKIVLVLESSGAVQPLTASPCVDRLRGEGSE